MASLIGNKNRVNFISLIISPVLMFMYLYNVSFLNYPGVTTTRISILILLVLALISNNLTNIFSHFRSYKFVILLFIPFIVWNFIHYIIGYGEPTQFLRSIYFFIYVIVLSPIVATTFNESDHFLISVFIAGLIQGFFVYIHFLVPEYKIWLSSTVLESGNVPLLSKVRSAGFSNGASSALSLIISLSVFSGLVLFEKSHSIIAKIIIIIGVLFVASSTILVGRLGLILSFYFMFFLLIYSLKSSRSYLVLGFSIFFILFFLGPLFYEFLSQNPKFETRVLSWAFSVLTNDDVTTNRLINMHIAPLNVINIFFGNGLVRNEYGMNASGSDIGYIQTYFASGLLMTVYFYLIFFCYIISLFFKQNSKFLSLIIMFPIFFVELKEPFVFKYMYPFFLLVFFHLNIKSKNMNNNINDKLEYR